MRQVTTEDLLGPATAVGAEMLEFRGSFPWKSPSVIRPVARNIRLFGTAAVSPMRASSMGQYLTSLKHRRVYETFSMLPDLAGDTSQPSQTSTAAALLVRGRWHSP